MPLLAVTSRLQHTSSLISQTCSLNTRPPGPFTHTLLGNVPITEIIRDADDSERKLIRLEGEEVERREVGVAAGASRRKASKAKGVVEESVEVFAGAALELVEEYESMPRAKQHILSLLEKSWTLHESIVSLQGRLAAARPASPEKPSGPAQPALTQIEDDVRGLENNIATIKRKRDELRARLRDKKHAALSPSLSPEAPTGFTPQQQIPRGDDGGDNPFLSRTGLGRSTGLRTAGSTQSEDHSQDLVGAVLQDSPTPGNSSVKRGILGLEEEEEWVERSLLAEEDEEEEALQQEEAEAEEDEEEPEMDEPTIILNAPPPLPPPAAQAPPAKSPARPRPKPGPEIAVTPAMEIAAARIWATPAAEALDPGAAAGTSRSARETILFLQALLAPSSPPPLSPPHPPSSISSLLPPSSHPTPDTLVLSRMLLTLLLAPSLAVPFNALKDGLRQFASERGLEEPGPLALRIIYGYGVGRRVVRIDRARGVVVFDYSS